jgi:epoxide hydrolase-like predicted phosphatase
VNLDKNIACSVVQTVYALHATRDALRFFNESGDFMIKHIIFDLGRVLVKVDLKPFIYQFSKAFNIEPDTLKKNKDDGVHLDFQAGKITGEDFHRITCENFNQAVPIDRFKDIWSSMLAGAVEGTAEIVNKLVEKDYTLSLLSNTDPWHFQYCEKNIAALQKFERKFLSYDLRMRKPDAEIFLTVAEKLAAKPEQCLFIDDLEENIEAAKSLNFHTVLFQNAEQLRNELRETGIGL